MTARSWPQAPLTPVPRVSICVPNLNTRPFLAERFRTIFDQTCQDWELLVYDSYSTDGAWEYISGLAAREPRMRAWQGPREGTPASWNPCIREARGEYVYIATSDDTMPGDCLEKLVAALDRYPDCDLAHCALKAIDEHGNEAEGPRRWFEGSAFARSSGALIEQLHLRQAPFDGLLHLLGGSVYVSITQLLIRRSLFDRIGYFPATWGSVGDFNWSMRAGLVANTVHVPDTWGGWRVHASQATSGAGLGTVEHARKIDAMIDHAAETCGEFLRPELRIRLISDWMPRARALRAYMREIRACTGGRQYGYVARRLLAGAAPAREHLQLRLRRRSLADWVTTCLEDVGIGPMLVAAQPAPPSRVSVRTHEGRPAGGH